MKHIRLIALTVTFVVELTLSLHAAPLDTAFAYQGRLTDTGIPAAGNYDVRFALFDGALAGSQIGPALTNLNVSVRDGLFLATLDFGAGRFDGTAYWLELAVRTNGSAGGFTTLNPRQPLTATPYALFTPNAGTAASASSANDAARLAGQLPSAFATTIHTHAGADITSGTVAGPRIDAAIARDNEILPTVLANDGAGSGLDADLLDGLDARAFWQLGGNAGTIPGAHFLGTRDNQPLELHVNGVRALRIAPGGTNNAPNIIGGSSANFVAAGVSGSTIAGGGTPDWYGSAAPNRITADFGTIAGGIGNTVSGDVQVYTGSVIGGGAKNTITNSGGSVIGGGGDNLIDGTGSATIGGGNWNRIEPSTPAATISGGYGNRIGTNGWWSTIAGGSQNTVLPEATFSTIGGGVQNRVGSSLVSATIGGGAYNRIDSNAWHGTISGGRSNTILSSAHAATIPGGSNNVVRGAYSFAAGNSANADHPGSFVWADSANVIFASTVTNQFAVRAGGGVRLETSGAGMTLDGQAVLSGSVTATQLADNSVGSSKIIDGSVSNNDISDTAAISPSKIADGAGSGLDADLLDGLDSAAFASASHNHDTTYWRLGGNSGTTPGTHFLGSTDNQPLELRVNNQRALRLEPNTNGAPNIIAGSPANRVAAGVAGATIAGGGALVFGDDPHTNFIAADFGTISGGRDNTIEAGAGDAAISGGYHNTIHADGQSANIGGGSGNSIETNSFAATIPGGYGNSATSYAFAAGTLAKANHSGAFVWADSQLADFPSTATNQFSVRAGGGVRLVTGGAGLTLDGQPVLSGAVTATQLADGAVTANKIAAGAVSQLGTPNGGDTDAVHVSNGGFVGVGTTTPQAGLDIAAGATVQVPQVRAQIADEQGSYTNLGGARSVAFSGTVLAVAADVDSAVTLVNVSDPANPIFLSGIRDGVGGFNDLEGARSVAFSGNLFAVAAPNDNAVTLVDVSNPVSPQLRAVLKDGVNGFDDLASAYSVAFSGNLLAVAADGDGAVTLVDVSNPASPQLRAVLKDGLGGFNDLEGAAAVAFSGNVLAVAASDDAAVTLVDVSNPASPQLRAVLRDGEGGFNDLADIPSMAFSGNLLAIASTDNDAVTLVDAANPASPQLRSVLKDGEAGFNDLTQPSSLAFLGNLLAVGSVSDGAVTLVDVSNPASPVLRHVVRDGVAGGQLLTSPYGVAFSGTLLAVAANYDSAFTLVDTAATVTQGLTIRHWVGVGTATPLAPLHVEGNIVVSGADLVDLNANRVELGISTTASGRNSTAMGTFTRALGDSSTAMGYSTTASGGNSTAVGAYTTASGVNSTAMGNSTVASGFDATAMGANTLASGFRATALGEFTRAIGEVSTAIGINTTAEGHHSTAMGANSIASGFRSTAMGTDTTAGGDNSTAMGLGTVARSSRETVLGSYNLDYTTTGQIWNAADRLFVIGNGPNSSAPSNALTMLKSGFVGFGSVTNPAFRLDLPNLATAAGQGRANAWNTYSDGRLKARQEELSYGLAEVMRLRPKAYNLHSDQGDATSTDAGVRQIGFIAQEVQEVLPEAVQAPADETKDLWSMDYQKLIPVLTRAVQELNQKLEQTVKEKDAEIQALKMQLAGLGKNNKEHEARLARLEKAVEAWDGKPTAAVTTRAED